MRKEKLFFILMFLFSVNLVFAQNINVKGVIIDAQTKTPIPSATIMIKGTTQGVVSDLDGKYSISVPSNGTLVFRFIGYETQEILVNSRKVINVTMVESEKMLDETIVVGYQTVTKKAFTGSASSIGLKTIEKQTDANPIKALEATVPGLQMSTSSGQPGAPSTIYIRGRSSINSGTQPLYVIDGVPMESGTWGMRSDEGSSQTPLSALNPNDIQSITVLKDATATSIYGSRAANGVIVITTKTARRGEKVKIAFNAKWGISDVPSFTSDYKTVNRDEFLELNYEGYANAYGVDLDAAKEGFWDPSFGSSYGYTEDDNIYTNWFDEVTRNGNVSDYNVSISSAGATPQSARVFVSFNYGKEEAIVIGKDFKKMGMRTNVVQDVNNYFTYGVNSSLSYTKTNMGASGGYFSDPITQAYMQSPLSPVYNEDGSFNFTTYNGYNPVAQRSELGDKSLAKTYRAILSPYITLKPIEGLSITSKLGIDFMYLDEFGYWSFLQPQGKDMKGMGENNVSRQTIFTWTNTANYIHTFNDYHHLNVMIGQEISRTNERQEYLSSSNYPVDYLNEVSLAATVGSAATYQYDLRLSSFFTNIQYDYDNKYFLSGSFREDGSSRFGENNKWASFWSVGAKYAISSEDFMEPMRDFITNLTVRSSYGTSGNQNVGDGYYASRGLYGYGYNYNSDGGSSQEQIANPDLKWEQVAKFNIGFDLGLVNRVNIGFDYYNHKTTDMVFSMPLSMTTGMSTISKNIGEMENKGIELSVSADVIRNENMSWKLSAVVSHNKNTVKKLSTEFPIEGTYTIVTPGKDYYTFYMKEYAGVNSETGKAQWYLNETGDETTEVYSDAAKRYLGHATPDMQGSVSSSLLYKGFDFSFQCNYSVGGKIYGSNLRYDEQTGSAWDGSTTKYVYKNRWQEVGDVTDVPKFVYGSNTANSHSSRYLMDGDYFKIQNITLGYTLPTDWTSKLHLSKVRIYVSGMNLYTFAASNYRGFDPSGISADGVQWWNFPSSRKFMFGLDVNF